MTSRRFGRPLAALTLALGLISFQAEAADMSAVETAPAQARGGFTGQSGHVTKGTAKIVAHEGKSFLVLGDDFWFDGAPAPRWGFGRGGSYVPGTQFAQLTSNTGAQVYEIPASIDAGAFDTVVLWCEQFSVPLGSATLN